MKHTLKILGAGIAVLLALVFLRIQDSYPIEVLRLKGLDYYQRTQEKTKSENIVVIEIDEKSLEDRGQWPWPRQELAEGIKKAFENEAAVVVLPIIFAEKDRLGGDSKFVETLQQAPIITSQSASVKGTLNIFQDCFCRNVATFVFLINGIVECRNTSTDVTITVRFY